MSQIVLGAGKRSHAVRSRKQLEIDLEEVMTNGVIDVYPFVEARGLLSLSFRRKKVTITAGPCVGLIPLTPSLVIDVRPKMPVANIARVLDLSRRSLEKIPGRDRYYRGEQLASESVLEFLAANLLEAVRELEIHGLHKDYVNITEGSSHPVGSIDIGSTLRDCWSRGFGHKISARRFDQTVDTAINRTIKGALHSVLGQLSAVHDSRQTLVSRLAKALWHFPRSVNPHHASDVEIARRVVERSALPPFRTYYYRALSIAIMILSRKGIALQGYGEDALLGTFIVNFENVFEDYLRNSLKYFAGDAVSVLDGNDEGKKMLFEDSDRHPAKPDILLVSNATKRRLVLEVKYKDFPNRNDINQAITYAVSYGTDQAILVHQQEGNTPTGLRHLGAVNGISVGTYAFDLGSEELLNEERSFAETIFGLLYQTATPQSVASSSVS